MTETLDLFPMNNTSESTDFALLGFYAQQGFLLLTTSQVCSVLRKTYGQVRYAVLSYELDAYLIAGEYRFSLAALDDYINGIQEKYEEAYHDVMTKREIYGVHELVFEGRPQQVLKSLQRKGYPETEIDGLLDKSVERHYDAQNEGVTEAEDFYGIPELNIPESIYLADFASLIQVDQMALAKDMGLPVGALLVYPEIYDYMVVKQFVNANVTLSSASSEKIIKDDGQLLLW